MTFKQPVPKLNKQFAIPELKHFKTSKVDDRFDFSQHEKF